MVRYEEHWLEEYSNVAEFLPPATFGAGTPRPRKSPKHTVTPKHSLFRPASNLSAVSSVLYSDSSSEDSFGIDWIRPSEGEELPVVLEEPSVQ